MENYQASVGHVSIEMPSSTSFKLSNMNLKIENPPYSLGISDLTINQISSNRYRIENLKIIPAKTSLPIPHPSGPISFTYDDSKGEISDISPTELASFLNSFF